LIRDCKHILTINWITYKGKKVTDIKFTKVKGKILFTYNTTTIGHHRSSLIDKSNDTCTSRWSLASMWFMKINVNLMIIFI